MIYRHLRGLEQDGLVTSKWNTDESGPAKRMYELTQDGMEMLDLWVDFMQRQDAAIRNFVDIYRRAVQGEGGQVFSR